MINIEKKNRISLFVGVFLLIIIVLIKVATYHPGWVEEHYSTGVYPAIARFYRNMFGWFPLSFGDLLYLTVIVYLCVKVFRLFKILRKRQWALLKLKTGYRRPFLVLTSVYILFNLSWGLNYNRLGIAHQLQLKTEEHNQQDLLHLTNGLIEKLNKGRTLLGTTVQYPHYRDIFTMAQAAYARTSTQLPFIRYDNPSIKRSMYGRAGIYLGFLGYYNPFSGEAQLNLTQPRFLIPFVTCHEMAHQLGYASESEANFVGFLAAVNSGNPLFEYSANFDLFNYANRELYKLDTATARSNVKRLDTLVRKDLAELREYYKKSDNVIEPIIKLFYDQYLKANQQEEGVYSYNEVVGWAIAYNKKYGRL